MIPTPEGFTCEGIGGGFRAWIARKKYEQHSHTETLEIRVCHSGWASVPETATEMQEPAFVEVFVDELSYDSPSEAVAIMEAHGLIGGSNGCSGALSWHFTNMNDALQFVRDFLRGDAQD